MKKVILLFSVFALFSMAQDNICELYIPIEKGTKITYEDYNAKDKLQGSQTMEVLDVVSTDAKISVTANLESFDKKGESAGTNEFQYSCENGEFKVNMESMIPTESKEGMKDMDLTITQENLVFPSVLTEGLELPDATVTMKAASNGINVMNMVINITDRKVLGSETITVEGGTFECTKLSQKTTTKMGFMNIETSSIDWIAPNIGTVRSESYDKKGQLESYRVLKSISK